MTSESDLLMKKIRHLSLALIVSGVLNIGVLSLLLFWGLWERPPTPYCELKPATTEEVLLPLVDQRGCSETLSHLSQLSFSQLVDSLSHAQLIENGYAERDLALACLVSIHSFDLNRALPKNAQLRDKRLLAWKPQGKDATIPLVVYPDINQEQFDSIIRFAKTERWPLTAEGLFTLLKENRDGKKVDDHLIETFVLTPEFWTVELLFNRAPYRPEKQEILSLLLDGEWPLLKDFVERQRQIHDPSDARRQKLLLDYLKAGSPMASSLLLKSEWDFSVKKLDDTQVISILNKMPSESTEAINYAKEMLASPRSSDVWRSASDWLYRQAGEPMPKEWSHRAALTRFVPEKALIALPPKSSPPSLGISASSSSVQAASSSSSKGIVAKELPSRSASIPSPKKIKEEVKSKKNEAQNLSSITSAKPKTVSQEPIIYIVQDGDSLWKIANRYGVKVDEIKALNQLKTDSLKKGTVLKIPRRKSGHPS